MVGEHRVGRLIPQIPTVTSGLFCLVFTPFSPFTSYILSFTAL